MVDYYALTLAGAALVEGVEHLLLRLDRLGNLCPGSIGEFSASIVITACGHRTAQGETQSRYVRIRCGQRPYNFRIERVPAWIISVTICFAAS